MSADLRIPYPDPQDRRQAERAGSQWPRHKFRARDRRHRKERAR